MEQTKTKSEGRALFIRNVPPHIIEKLKRYKRDKRLTMAGVLIELVEFADSSKYFKDEGH